MTLDIILVKLQTNQLNAMKFFYENILGFKVLEEAHNKFTIQTGLTVVTFSDERVTKNPFYHFAFDIPSNQFNSAKEWIKQKVQLSTENDEDEVYFDSIKARSLYFEDPAGNIVEFISRLEDSPKSNLPFTIDHVIKMSEMSLVVEDKITVANELNKMALSERDQQQISTNSLSFIGTRKHPVYLLLVDAKRRWFFSKKEAVVYPQEILLDSGIQITIDDNHQFHIIKL